MSKLIKPRRVGASLLKGRLDSMIQGISQQPASARPAGKAEASINTWPSPVEGLTRRRPTRLRRRVSTVQLTDLWADTSAPQTGERYSFVLSPDGGNVRLDVSLDGAPCSLDVHGLGLTASGSAIIGTPASYLYRASGLASSYRLINSGAISLLLNRNISARLSDEISPVIPSDALIFVQAVTFDVGFNLTLNGVALPEYRTPKSTDTINTLSTAVTATQLASRINAVPGFTAQSFGALVYLNKTDGSAFSVSLDDSRSNALARVLKETVSSFSYLPAVAREGFFIKVASDPSSDLDDYWVKFSATDKSSLFGEGFWQECPAPGIKFKFSNGTLPLVIYRAAAGVLFVGPADGAARSITVGPTTYNYTFPLWGERTAGDERTVPTPSFDGKAIRDHLIHRGRYVVFAGNSIVLSETDNIFNFFQDTSTTVLDTDPIDLLTPAEGSTTPLLNWGIAVDESILAFSESAQFQVRAADAQVMTPKTTECIRLSGIDMNPLIPPKLAGPNVVFGTSETGFTGFREYQFINTESRRLGLNLGGSLSITSEVPRLIPSLADVWDVSEGLDFMVVSSPVDRSKLYVYKYLWSTTQNSLSKQQSAWQVWQFDGNVQWAKFYENRLWLLVSYADGTYLCDMPTPELRSDTVPDFCLDRAIDFPECNSDTETTNNITATYDSGANRTTFTLPYSMTAETAAVVRFDNTRQRSLQIGRASSGNQIICAEPGDWTADKITFGARYLSSHTFSTAYPPASAEGRDRIIKDQTGRLQILNWSVFHSDSGPYTIRVKRRARSADTVKRFSPRQVNVQLNTLDAFNGTLDTGRFRTMVGTRNLDCVVSVESDSVFPFTITGASWEGAYNDRAQGTN
jgi:hypothetical protein